MNSDLDGLVSKAKELEQSGDVEGAISLANELVAQHPDEIKAWSLRGYLYALNHEYEKAAADLTRVIEINAADPYHFYSRGRYRFALGQNESALDDFTEALGVCDRYKNDDYREELYFWRAEVLLRLGKKRGALADLAHVRDSGFTSWTYKLRTKADLLADCAKLPG